MSHFLTLVSFFSSVPRRGPRPGVSPATVLVAVLLLTGLFVMAPAGSLHADVIFVNTLTDENNTDGDCSLREAIAGANNDSVVDGCSRGLGADLIVVPLEGILDLTLGVLRVSDQLEIILSSNLVIDAGYRSRIFVIDLDTDSLDFSLNGGTLTRGQASSSEGGGALLATSAGSVVLEDVVLLRNRTCYLTFQGSCLPNFAGDSNVHGGAVSILSGLPALRATGRGGSLQNVYDLQLRRVRFEGNSAHGSGGAVYVGSALSGSLYTKIAVEDCYLVRNSALQVGGGMTLDSSGPISIERSRFFFNRASVAGAMFVDNPVGQPEALLRNLLMVGNAAATYPALLQLRSNGELWFSTFVRNVELGTTGDAPAVGTFGKVSHNTISNNESGDCSFIGESLGFNVDSDGSCGFDHASDRPSQAAPHLPVVELADGLLIVLPTEASIVVDGGETANNCPGPVGDSTLIDLRGEQRSATARTAISVCDIGAVELQPEDRLLAGDSFEEGHFNGWEDATR